MRAQLDEIARVVRRIIGVPDYDAYVAHVRSSRPDEEVLTRERFLRDALDGRYLGPGSRCC